MHKEDFEPIYTIDGIKGERPDKKEDDKEAKTTEIKFRRNKRGRVEAVHDDGTVNEMVSMGDLIGMEGAPYTPEEYLKSRNNDDEDIKRFLDGMTASARLQKMYGEKKYQELIEAGVIKDPDFK